MSGKNNLDVAGHLGEASGPERAVDVVALVWGRGSKIWDLDCVFGVWD